MTLKNFHPERTDGRGVQKNQRALEEVLQEGHGSNVDSDLLDGMEATDFAATAHTHDHGAELTGLGDDDHPQYHNDARGDVRYLKLDASNDPLTGHLQANDGISVLGDLAVRGGTSNGRIIFQPNDLSILWLLQVTQSSGAWILRDSTAGTNPFIVEAGTPSNALYLKAGGNVGIGTAAPSQKLQVAGTARVDSRLGVGGAPHATRTLEVTGAANVTGNLTEAGFRAIAVETDGRFKVALYSDSTPRGFSRVTGVDGAVIRLEDSSGAGTSDVGSGRKDVGAATTEGHALTVAGMPAHTHDVKFTDVEVQSGTGATASVVGTPNTSTAPTSSTGGGATHDHQILLKYSNFGLYQFDGA